MHKLILTGTAVLAIHAAGPAQAQRVVLDPSNLAQAVRQVYQLQQQILVMQQQYAQLQQTYRAVSHSPSSAINYLGQRLNTEQFRNALPDSSDTMGSVLSGAPLATGYFGGVVRGHLNRNQVYSPTGSDFQAAELRRGALSVAGAQASASELYQSAANRVRVLQAIEGELANARDTKDVADLQARINAEQAYIQAQQVQAQSLAMWQQSQERNRMQRNQEMRRQQIDTLIEQAKARGG